MILKQKYLYKILLLILFTTLFISCTRSAQIGVNYDISDLFNDSNSTKKDKSNTKVNIHLGTGFGF